MSEEFWLDIAGKALWAVFWVAFFFGGSQTVRLIQKREDRQ